eukprot:2418604-Alexandrium_andersonii.AAC.1
MRHDLTSSGHVVLQLPRAAQVVGIRIAKPKAPAVERGLQRRPRRDHGSGGWRGAFPPPQALRRARKAARAVSARSRWRGS